MDYERDGVETPKCPYGHGKMQYLTHIPFKVCGKPDIHNSRAAFIQFGCVECGVIIKMVTKHRQPFRLTPEPKFSIK
jgi:hypothetical protein